MFTSTCNSPSSLNFPASLGLPAAVPACSSLTSRAISSHFPVPRLLGSPSSSSQGVRNSGRREWLGSVVVVEDRRRDSVACRVGMVGESDFGEEVLGSDLPILVEFVADWCGPCRLMSPTVDWASEEYKGKLKVVKIDHDQNPKLIQDYKVFGLPTFILFKNGQEVPESRREGAITKIKLKEYIDNLLESITVS